MINPAWVRPIAHPGGFLYVRVFDASSAAPDARCPRTTPAATPAVSHNGAARTPAYAARMRYLAAVAAITTACGGSTAPQMAQDEPDAAASSAATCDHRARGGPFHVVYDATTADCPARPPVDEANGVAALGTACFGSGFDWSADGCTLTVAERCAGYTLTATTTAEPSSTGPARRVTGTATFGDGCTYVVTATR